MCKIDNSSQPVQQNQVNQAQQNHDINLLQGGDQPRVNPIVQAEILNANVDLKALKGLHEDIRSRFDSDQADTAMAKGTTMSQELKNMFEAYFKEKAEKPELDFKSFVKQYAQGHKDAMFALLKDMDADVAIELIGTTISDNYKSAHMGTSGTKKNNDPLRDQIVDMYKGEDANNAAKDIYLSMFGSVVGDSDQYYTAKSQESLNKHNQNMQDNSNLLKQQNGVNTKAIRENIDSMAKQIKRDPTLTAEDRSKALNSVDDLRKDCLIKEVSDVYDRLNKEPLKNIYEIGEVLKETAGRVFDFADSRRDIDLKSLYSTLHTLGVMVVHKKDVISRDHNELIDIETTDSKLSGLKFNDLNKKLDDLNKIKDTAKASGNADLEKLVNDSVKIAEDKILKAMLGVGDGLTPESLNALRHIRKEKFLKEPLVDRLKLVADRCGPQHKLETLNTMLPGVAKGQTHYIDSLFNSQPQWDELSLDMKQELPSGNNKLTKEQKELVKAQHQLMICKREIAPKMVARANITIRDNAGNERNTIKKGEQLFNSVQSIVFDAKALGILKKVNANVPDIDLRLYELGIADFKNSSLVNKDNFIKYALVNNLTPTTEKELEANPQLKDDVNFYERFVNEAVSHYGDAFVDELEKTTGIQIKLPGRARIVDLLQKGFSSITSYTETTARLVDFAKQISTNPMSRAQLEGTLQTHNITRATKLMNYFNGVQNKQVSKDVPFQLKMVESSMKSVTDSISQIDRYTAIVKANTEEIGHLQKDIDAAKTALANTGIQVKDGKDNPPGKAVSTKIMQALKLNGEINELKGQLSLAKDELAKLKPNAPLSDKDKIGGNIGAINKKIDNIQTDINSKTRQYGTIISDLRKLNPATMQTELFRTSHDLTLDELKGLQDKAQNILAIRDKRELIDGQTRKNNVLTATIKDLEANKNSVIKKAVDVILTASIRKAVCENFVISGQDIAHYKLQDHRDEIIASLKGFNIDEKTYKAQIDNELKDGFSPEVIAKWEKNVDRKEFDAINAQGLKDAANINASTNDIMKKNMRTEVDAYLADLTSGSEMKHVFFKGGFISLGTGFKAVPGLKMELSAELAKDRELGLSKTPEGKYQVEFLDGWDAKGGIGASFSTFFGMAKGELEAGGKKLTGAALQFKEIKDCSDFLVEMFHGSANEESLLKADLVMQSKSTTISGKAQLSAKLGLEPLGYDKIMSSNENMKSFHDNTGLEVSVNVASGGIALEGEKTWKESRSYRGLVKENEKHYTLTVSGSVGLNARAGYNFNIESDKTSKYHIPDGKIGVEQSGGNAGTKGAKAVNVEFDDGIASLGVNLTKTASKTLIDVKEKNERVYEFGALTSETSKTHTFLASGSPSTKLAAFLPDTQYNAKKAEIDDMLKGADSKDEISVTWRLKKDVAMQVNELRSEAADQLTIGNKDKARQLVEKAEGLIETKSSYDVSSLKLIKYKKVSQETRVQLLIVGMKKGASTETENVVKTISFGNPPVQQPQPQAQQNVQQPQVQPQHVPQQPQQHQQPPQQSNVQQPQGQAQPDINLQSQPQPDINAINAQQLHGAEVVAHGVQDANILNNILPPDIKVTDIHQQSSSNECFFVGTLLGAINTTWGKATLMGMFKEQDNNVQIQIQGKDTITLTPEDRANEHNSGGSQTNAPWVKTLEQAYFKETGHSLLQMGEIIAAPRFFNWNVDHWPPQDMNFNDKQQVKESVRTWITEAKNGDFGVTYLRHGHVVAIKGIESDNVICINSLRQHEEPDERVSLDDVVNALTQNKANFAKFKPA
ncbi:MAG: hypothetical protein HQL01_08770 [Nitrospirae bacterium]|nr:hypothetical protein [Nitrospirota bacterium]